MKKQLLLLVPFISVFATGCGELQAMRFGYIQNYKNQVSGEVFQDKLYGASTTLNNTSIHFVTTMTPENIDADLVFEASYTMFTDAIQETIEGATNRMYMCQSQNQTVKYDKDSDVASIQYEQTSEYDMGGYSQEYSARHDYTYTSTNEFDNLGHTYIASATPVNEYVGGNIASPLSTAITRIKSLITSAHSYGLPIDVEDDPEVDSVEYYIDGDTFTYVSNINPDAYFISMGDNGTAGFIKEVVQMTITAAKISFGSYIEINDAVTYANDGSKTKGSMAQGQIISISQEKVELAVPEIANYPF